MKRPDLIPPRIACVSQKGGGGKSMVAANLAVAAALDGRGPEIIDMDDQRSLAGLWASRRGTSAPKAKVSARNRGWDELASELDGMRGANCGLVVIDTPGSRDQVASLAASVSNIVLVVVQTSLVDLATLASTFKLKNVTNRPAFAVLNQVRNKGNLKEAKAIVKNLGYDLCPHVLSDLAVYVDAFDSGLGVLEYELSGTWTKKTAGELALAQTEVTDLYRWALEQVATHAEIRLPADKPTWRKQT